MEPFIAIVILGIVLGLPASLITLHLKQRHREKMRALEVQGGPRIAELEATRVDLEARVRALETIATAGDRDLEERLRRLGTESGAHAPRSLPPGE